MSSMAGAEHTSGTSVLQRPIPDLRAAADMSGDHACTRASRTEAERSLSQVSGHLIDLFLLVIPFTKPREAAERARKPANEQIARDGGVAGNKTDKS